MSKSTKIIQANSERVEIRLTPSLKERAEEKANAQGLSVSAYIRRLIARGT